MEKYLEDIKNDDSIVGTVTKETINHIFNQFKGKWNSLDSLKDDVKKVMMNQWYEGLQDFDKKPVLMACKWFINDCDDKYYPNISSFRKTVKTFEKEMVKVNDFKVDRTPIKFKTRIIGVAANGGYLFEVVDTESTRKEYDKRFNEYVEEIEARKKKHQN